MIFRTITDDITGANKSIGFFGKSLNDIKGIINSFKQNGFVNTLLNTPLINIDIDAIDNYNNAISAGKTYEDALATARRTTNAETVALIESSHGAEVQIEQVTAAQKASTIAAKAHSVALKAASTAGNMILFAAVTKGLELAAKSFDDYIHRAEKATERTDELFSEFRKMNSSLADHRKTVSELAERYDKLAKGTDLSNNKNLSLSASEYEEFLNINEQLAGSFPQLAAGIDENGNSILALGTKGITAKEQLEELLQTEEDLNNFRIAQELKDVFEGVYTYTADANKAADKLDDTASISSEAIGILQEVSKNGISLNEQNGGLIFSGNINNQAELGYMGALTASANEFWKSLDGFRRAELNGLGINNTTLFGFNQDEYTGAFEVYLQAYTLTPKEITDLENIIQNNVINANGALIDSVNTQMRKLQEQVQKGENAWTDFIPALVSSMKSKQTFKNLDSDLQGIAEQIVKGLDYSYAAEMQKYNPDPYAYIRDKFIIPMGNLEDSDKKKLQSSFEALYKLDPKNLSQSNQSEIERIIDTIAALLEKEPLEIRATLGYDIEHAKNNYNKSLENAKRQLGGYGYDDKGFETKTATGNKIDEFWDENVITEEDCILWEKVTEGISDATKAMDTYSNARKNAVEFKTDTFSIPETIDAINALSDGFDAIGKIYSDIKNDGTFDFSLLDSKNFKETFSDLDTEYNAFIEKVASSPNDINGCQDAFNSLVGRWIESKGVLQNLTQENAQVTASMLQNMGVANAQELVDGALIRKKYQLLTASKEYIEASDEVKQAMFDESIAGETLEQAVSQISLQRQIANANALDTSADVDAIYSLAQAAGFSAESLYHLAEARAFLMEAEESGDADQINEAKEGIRRIVALEQQKLASYSQYTDPSNKPGGVSPSGAGRDTHLEEYRQKLEELQTMLDRELINEKEFYDQSNTLLNDYLKDTPAHLQKYADEISNAEKTLRGNWISSFGYEKSQLEKDLSDSTLVQWQYYERLSELAQQYYNTEGASYGKFADEYGEITQEIKDGQEKLWDDIFSEVNSQLDGLQSACETVRDAVAEYSENGSLSIDTMQKLIALEPQYMAMLFDENGQLQLNAQAYERLAKTKLEELKIDLAGQALNTINSLQSEAQAVEMLTGKYAELRDTGAGAIEQQLRDAVAEAYGRGEQQGKAAEMVLQAYVNQKKVIDATDLSSLSITAEQKDSDADRFLKTFDWIGTLLKKISDSTSKLIDKADRFYNWQKKNSMINRAVKSASREISQNELAYQTYMKKANSVGLGLNYVRKVQDGTLSVEDVTDENTANKIEKYQEWYDKAQACLDTVEDLYDRQRDLIRQKLDNVLEYYSSMDSYLSSITSKIESVISLNDGMGKRTSLTELVEQFAAVSDRLENAKTKNNTLGGMTDTAVTEGSFGGSKKVAEANERDRKELADTIQTEIDDLDVKKTGNYKKLRDKIADTQSEIDRYRNNGWDKSKAKSYEKLQKELQDYYDLQKALDENATSDTIANYEKIYTKYQKLQNKLDSGKTLSKSEQKRYDSYAGQLDGLKARGQSALDSLHNELAKAEGTAPKQSEAERIQDEIDGIRSDLEGTATYRKLDDDIRKTEKAFADKKYADLDEEGFEKLSKKQKSEYKKMQKQLGDYYAQKKALDEGATASNIAEYNKTYLEWKKLQDKLDSGKNLTQSQWKQYNNYTKQLENFRNEKSDTLDGLKAALEEAQNPSDRLEQIEKTFEESSKGIRDSYLGQIDGINGEAENSQQYQNLKAKAQNLEQKKKDKGLSPSEQAKLDKYNAELNALETGATGANIKDYMKTWESWYTLEQKRNKNGKLSDSDAKKYDGYKAKLDAWNNEKQTQINDLLSLMEDDLEQLKMTYSENVSEAESEINDYYANLYSLAKQIAEYNVSSLQTQLTYLESCISYYKELVSLYDSFDGDKLVKILTDLGEISAGDELSSRQDLYSGYLDKLQEKYDTTLSQINEYSQLLKALETGDFESSMGIFSKAMEDYRAEGNTEMADKMQSVLDLLNERASGADGWDEYADEWKNEWEEALSSVKQDLIGTAEEIQEINDALREIRFEHITDAIAELDRASGMLSSIESLIQDDWLFEPDGSLSEYGRAKAALLVSQLEDAQAQADAYLNLYNEIQNSKDTYASDKEYREASNDALQNYYDSLNSAASLENSITDLMKKNAEAEINSLKDVIEARKQALQSKKEYYDYDKSIKNSQKEIDSLKAQIDALENLSDATDAATKAKLAQLKAELEEKEDALQETKDEHTFNLQIDALDEFSNSLTDALDSSAKSVEEILKEQKEIVESAKELSKTSAESTNKTIDLLTSFYSGMGISIDGTDLIPPTTETANGGTPNTGTAIPDLNPDNNENLLVSAINKTTDTTEQFRQETIDRFTKLLEEHGLLPEMISAAFPWENVIMPRLNEGIDRLNEFIQTKEDAQSVVINNHYDSLINVEGNVDKHVAKLLPEQLQQCYKYTTAQIYNDIHRIGSRKNAANAINTLVT